MFNALVVNKDEDGKTSSGVSQVTLEDLPMVRWWLRLSIQLLIGRMDYVLEREAV